MRIEPRHDRCAGRCAHWLRHIGRIEHEALLGESIQVRGLQPVVSITGEGVVPLLVGKDEKDVWFVWHSYPGASVAATGVKYVIEGAK